MEYKSFADVALDISRNLPRIPRDVDLIVGVPRSGIMVGSILALTINTRLCDVDTFCENGRLRHGTTRAVGGVPLDHAQEAGSVLVVDDSISSGTSMKAVKERISRSGYDGKVTYLALYATERSKDQVDLYLEIVPMPRLFQWNLFHRRELEQCCIDIDGVLCVDPTEAENDDGVAYRAFLSAARPLARPTVRLGHLVTSRLEKYRLETEQWLASNRINYVALHMLDLPSAAERRRLDCHAAFKARVYASKVDSILFIESELQQARQIANMSGKSVLHFETNKIFDPKLGLTVINEKRRSLVRRILSRLRQSGR